MAITVSSDLELLALNELLGFIQADQDPLHTLMRRTNWHYGNHKPALITLAPQVAAAATNEVIVPVFPSADGLTYDSKWLVYAASTGTVDVDLQESTTYGGVYTSVSAFPNTTASITAGNTDLFTFDAALAASTRFIKVRALNGAGNVQSQGLLLAPKKLTSIASGALASGMTAYDDAALTATGGPIHTEYFERGRNNIRSTYSDRRQCLWSWVQAVSPARHTFAATNQYTSKYIGLAGYDLPVTVQTNVTVYAKCADSGGGSGDVVVGQVGSSFAPVTITADDVARSATLTLDPQAPQALYALAVNPSGTMTPRYIVVEWTPTIGSATPLIGSVAPPPLRGYLTALDQLSLAGCLTPYAGAGVCIDAGLAGGTYWHHGIQVGPGIKALQPLVTISRSNGTAVGTSAEFWTTDSGATANDKILVDSPQSGTVIYPPVAHAEVVPGSEGWDTTPAAPSYRLAEITADREATYQQVYGRYYAGWGYRSIPFAPPTSLP